MVGCFWGAGCEGEDVEGGVDEENNAFEVWVHGEGCLEADSAGEMVGQYEGAVGLGFEVCKVCGLAGRRHHGYCL